MKITKTRLSDQTLIVSLKEYNQLANIIGFDPVSPARGKKLDGRRRVYLTTQNGIIFRYFKFTYWGAGSEESSPEWLIQSIQNSDILSIQNTIQIMN